MDAPSVFLRTPWNGPWRKFTRPDAIFETRVATDVCGILAEVDAAIRRTRQTKTCAAGFVAYEAASAFGLPVREPSDNELPLVWFGLFPAEHIESVDAPRPSGAHRVGPWQPSIPHDAYQRGIESIRSRIEAGDTYQINYINYTWRLRAAFEGDPLSLLVALDAAQRGAWSAYLDLGRHVICSASPELFFLMDGERIECRPMKGTAPRGRSSAADRARGQALASSEKNRAENVMVVDMTRNDLGRVARVGSVTVPSLFAVEQYPAQWQMVSTVSAVAEAPTLSSLFDALFPSGSVTGAPKHRSMSIISGLECGPRGIYTGAIGMFSEHRAHFNVAIRTVHIDRQREIAEFGVGSGIVWDSIEGDEYEECLIKASILTRHEPVFDLLESLAWSPDEGFVLLEAHLDRLRASAVYFDFEPVSDLALREALDASVRGCTVPQKVRLRVARDGRVRAEAAELTGFPEPRRAALAAQPVSLDDVFLYHKTTRREVYEEAHRSRPDADVVILWNTNGEITEATDANVVVEVGGRRVTPPVACGLLPGVMRGALLDAGEIFEERVTIDQLRDASAAWLINSVRGWMTVAMMR